MKISLITTVYNEQKTIDRFLTSLFLQTKLPHEIIIVDGGSTDATVDRINSQRVKFRKKQLQYKLYIKKGNRSVGRNEAIKKAKGDIIVCSDAGNELDKNWIENISKPFKDKTVDVVAGYYKGKPKNVFQKCLIPYTLVMPDKVDSQHFLPATRSVAFRKSIWKKVGGFDEALSHNEDYVFANKLESIGAKIVFAKDAIVKWFPRDTYKAAFIMFYRFALGDAEAKMQRPTVMFIFARYLLGIYYLFLILLYKSIIGAVLLIVFILLYLIWAIKKNYRYVKDRKALIILPKLQITADVAVMMGTLYGFFKTLKKFNPIRHIKENKLLYGFILLYLVIVLSTIRWGIPNENRAFPFHMDEWHQLQAVGNTFRYGTPNVEGSANGTMFHFIYSGFYLIPFTILQYINPFELQIDNALMRERIFEVLRLQTILFGLLSILVFYQILKFLKAPKLVGLFFFTFSPIWLMLSGYYKYDIALLFFILVSIYFFLKFVKQPNSVNYVLAAIPAALSVAVKVSAIPLLPIYIICYLLFMEQKIKHIKTFFIGMSVFTALVLLFGLPDTLFGKGNILYYLYDNVHQTPNASLNFMLQSHPLFYLFTRQFPIIYGYALYIAATFSLLYWIILFLKTGIRKSLDLLKYEMLIIISFLLFLASILPLQIYAGGNRSLVLLPFMIFLVTLSIKVVLKKENIIVIPIIVLVSVLQLFQCFSWVYMKSVPSPQEISSQWINDNVKHGEQIGIENIPIYQQLPDLVQKEFYYKQYNVAFTPHYTYRVIDAKTTNLPSIIVVTNETMDKRLLKASPKNALIHRLQKEKYKSVKTFTPEFIYFKAFGEEFDFYLANILTMPVIITVYEKEKSIK